MSGTSVVESGARYKSVFLNEIQSISAKALVCLQKLSKDPTDKDEIEKLEKTAKLIEGYFSGVKDVRKIPEEFEITLKFFQRLGSKVIVS